SAGISNLKEWVSKPVVYHSRVLAKAEERTVSVQISTNTIPNSYVPVGTYLTPIQTQNYFNYNQEVFDKITYQIASVIQTGNANNTFPASRLGLSVIPIDNFNATLQSIAPMPADALTPSQYTVNLQASGYRNGQVVSQI